MCVGLSQRERLCAEKSVAYDWTEIAWVTWLRFISCWPRETWLWRCCCCWSCLDDGRTPSSLPPRQVFGGGGQLLLLLSGDVITSPLAMETCIPKRSTESLLKTEWADATHCVVFVFFPNRLVIDRLMDDSSKEPSGRMHSLHNTALSSVSNWFCSGTAPADTALLWINLSASCEWIVRILLRLNLF